MCSLSQLNVFWIIVILTCACLEPGSQSVQESKLDDTDLFQQDFTQSEDPNKLSKLRKLTRIEYSNALWDLFQIDVGTQTANFPREDSSFGFTQIQNLSHFTSHRMEVQLNVATSIAPLIYDKINPIEVYFKGCVTPPSCPKSLDNFLREIGPKFHKGPLSDESLHLYTKLYESIPGDQREKVTTVLTVMLQSPNFLFSLPKDSPSFEMMEKLSLFLWKSVPDENLQTIAATLDPNDTQAVKALIRTMMEDPRALRGLKAFFTDWLALNILNGLNKDRNILGNEADEQYMKDAKEEVLLLLLDLWNEDQNFKTLFDAPYTYVSQGLAKVYNMDDPGEGFRKVDLKDNPERFGFLSSAAFSAILSKGVFSSPSARGLYVMRKFLCEDVPPPPPGLGAFPEELRDMVLSPREKMARHAASEQCAGCHVLMDPIGMAFENYDAIGRFRNDYSALKSWKFDFGDDPIQVANSIDVQGQKITFESPKALSI